MPDWVDRRLRSLGPIGVFCLTTFAFMPLCLLGLRTFVSVDLNQVGYPYDGVSADSVTRPTLQTDQIEWIPWLVDFWVEVRGGNFPLWTHDIAGGSPHGTMPYLGTLSPFNFGFAFLPDWYALNIGVALTFLAGQWGMYLLVRRFGVGQSPAVVAGVMYGFTGTYLALVHRVTAIVLAPLLLWAVHRLIDRPSGRRVAVVGGLLTWSWLTGFPSGFVYAVYLAGAFATWLIIEHRLADGWFAQQRTGYFATAVVLGVAGSAITLLPFVTEAVDRGALTERVWGGDDHMPTANIFGLFDQAALGNAVSGPWFTGWNPIETSSQIGFIGLLFTAAFLALATVGRLPIPDAARPVWRFLCALAVLTTILVWLGGPLLWLVYRLPGIGSGPIQRLRYFLAIAIVGLFAMGLQSVWTSRDSEGERGDSPKLSSALTLGFFVAVFAWQTPDYWDLMNQWGQRRNVGLAVISGVFLTAIAAVLTLRARRFPIARPGVAVALAALVFLQAWYPFRDLTPQADPDWFYTETAAHESVRAAADDRYRFLAPGAANFYPNGSQVYDLVDLRGVAVYDTDFKAAVEVASPDAFRRDPFKITSIASEWDFSSPMLDDLAIGVVALAPLNYTERSSATGTAGLAVDGYIPTAQIAGNRRLVSPSTSLQVAILRRGSCDGDRWKVTITQAGNQVDAISGWLVDVPEAEFGVDVTFAVDPSSVAPNLPLAIDVAMPFDDDCEAAVGITSQREVAVAMGAAPDPALQLVATDEAAVYRRPTAKELVWSTGDWAVTDNQDDALAFVGTGTTGVVTDVDDIVEPTVGATAADITDFAFLDDRVVASVSAPNTALIVVSQHLANGWRVWVDGEESDLVAVHGALAGVVVEAGSHEIELRYEPSAFSWGWKISLIAAVAGVVAFVVNPKPRDVRRQRSPQEPGSSSDDEAALYTVEHHDVT